MWCVTQEIWIGQWVGVPNVVTPQLEIAKMPSPPYHGAIISNNTKRGGYRSTFFYVGISVLVSTAHIRLVFALILEESDLRIITRILFKIRIEARL